MLLLSGAIISIGDLFIYPAYVRYLAFVLIGVFVMVSLAYDRSDKSQNNKLITPQRIYLSFLGLLIISIACANYYVITGLDFTPNEAQVGLINYLEKNNYTYGYAGPQDANVITYLSNEKVTLRAIKYLDGQIHLDLWQASRAWENEKIPEKYVIVFDDRDKLGDNMTRIASEYPPDMTLVYKGFTIFEYDNKNNTDLDKLGIQCY